MVKARGNIKRFSKLKMPGSKSGARAARGHRKGPHRATRSGKATNKRMPTVNAGPKR